MNIRVLSPPPSPGPRRTASFAPIVLLALLAGETLLVFTSRNPGRATARAPNSLPRPYFQNGQWLADVRTLTAAARYLLESESAWPRNSGWTGAVPALPLTPVSLRELAPDRNAHTS